MIVKTIAMTSTIAWGDNVAGIVSMMFYFLLDSFKWKISCVESLVLNKCVDYQRWNYKLAIQQRWLNSLFGMIE